MPTITELQQRLARLDNEKAQVRSALASEKRRADTKRKVLYGAAALALAETDAALRERLMAHLDATLTRDGDRAALGLGPKPKK